MGVMSLQMVADKFRNCYFWGCPQFFFYAYGAAMYLLEKQTDQTSCSVNVPDEVGGMEELDSP